MTRNHLVGPSLSMLAIAEALVLSSLREPIVFFNSPTDVADKKTSPGKPARLGNVVKMGSLERSNNLQVHFEATDCNTFTTVSCAICSAKSSTEGHVEPDDAFKPEAMLAKHDENYMAREVIETLKKQGRWQETSARTKGTAM